MATLIEPDGTKTIVEPADGKEFKLTELYALLHCEMIQILDLKDYDDISHEKRAPVMIIDENGKLDGSQLNPDASILMLGRLASDDYIVGAALVCHCDYTREGRLIS